MLGNAVYRDLPPVGAGNGKEGQKQMIMVIAYANTWLQVPISYFGTIKLVLPLQVLTLYIPYFLILNPRIFHGLDAYPEFFLPTPSPQNHS